MRFIYPHFADCYYHFYINGTKLNKRHVCHYVGYFAVFCPCDLSSDSARTKERLRTLTEIRWYFKLGIIKTTILPNISVVYTQEISRAFVVAILDITALSFISLGAQRPMPEWGAMIKDSLELIYLAPWTVFITRLCYYFHHFIKHYFY